MHIYTINPLSQTPDTAQIACYPWGRDYCPRAQAHVSWSESGLHIAMTAWEQTIIAQEARFGGDVFRDSCMEMFFQPCPLSDSRYFNCEVNAAGVMHIGVGQGREGRIVLREMPQGIDPVATVRQGERWDIRYTLPTGFIRSWFPGWTPEKGAAMRGNFYKCDESIHPHFGCWNEIRAEAPDFHRPEYFGQWILA